MFVLREVAAECERPVLLFSGGKDSAVLLRLAEKAFRPGRFPFPVMHVDTGHNFDEVLEYRDKRMADLGEELLVASVQDSIDRGRVADPGAGGSRNRLQSVTLLDAVNAHSFDACIGGARRDEDKARAKERVLSFRDAFGQWDPRNQRPELWHLYHGRVRNGRAPARLSPVGLDRARHLAVHPARAHRPAVDLLRAPTSRRRARWHAPGRVGLGRPRPPARSSRTPRSGSARSATPRAPGAVRSSALTVDEVIAEVASSRVSERGATRADDRFSETSMEDRKREGYF